MEENKHPIDKKIAALLEKDSSTAGAVQAMSASYKLWDAELNKQYKQLMSRFKGRDKDALMAAQRAWIAFRDQEFVVINAVYNKLQGTMYHSVRVSAKLELVKSRALELTRHNDALSEAE
jgi:uncharacterized protein YecT (DUF1311 family)